MTNAVWFVQCFWSGTKTLLGHRAWTPEDQTRIQVYINYFPNLNPFLNHWLLRDQSSTTTTSVFRILQCFRSGTGSLTLLGHKAQRPGDQTVTHIICFQNLIPFLHHWFLQPWDQSSTATTGGVWFVQCFWSGVCGLVLLGRQAWRPGDQTRIHIIYF